MAIRKLEFRTNFCESQFSLQKMDEFFQRLRDERKRLKLSQDELAAIAGISKNTQSNYETGARLPDVGYLHAIQPAGVDCAFLVTGLRTFDPNAVAHDNPAPTLAARLQQERKRLGLTETELARNIGAKKQTVQQLESGELVPDANALLQLHAAGVDIVYVLLSLRSGASDRALGDDEKLLLQDHAKATDEGRTLLRNVAAMAAKVGQLK